MESGRLWASIARHWLLSSLVLLLVLATAVAAAYIPKRSYEAIASFGLVPTAPVNTSPTGQTQLAQALVGNYLAEINSKTTEARVRSDFTGPEATKAWKATGENEPGTLVIRIHVRSEDPAVVATVANDYSQLLRAPASAPDGIGFQVIDQARIPTSPISPNRPLILGAGVLLALILSAAAALLAGAEPKPAARTRGSRPAAPTPAVAAAPVSPPIESERAAEAIRG